jgi:RHS repeat-associated protein
LVREIRDPGALNLVTKYRYDDNDNRIETIDPRLNATNFAYDVQNRLTLLTDALGNTTETRYDGVGNRLCSIDANLHYTSYEYDALSRLVRENRKIGTQECTGGDSDDIITQHFYDSGAPIACNHDPGSPTCDGPMPGGGSIAYSIDPEGKYTYFKYDKVDRRWITIRKVADTADTCDGDDWCEYTKYDPADNVYARIDANGNRTDMEYYANDWLKKETVDPGGLNLMTSYTYDGAGNQQTVTTPRGNVITNTYDARNQLIQGVDLVGLVASYAYDGIGNRIQECDGNGHCTGYSYDKVNRLVDVVDPMGETALNGYDENGNLTDRVDQLGQVTEYEYNDLYYLTKRDYQDPPEPDDLFTYDTGGRMTGATKDYPAADPRPDWVVTFDAYDAVNRLLQTTQDATGVPTVVGYDYDTPTGRRTLCYPGGRVITEFTDLRERIETVNRGPGPAFPITPLAFYQYDLGNRVVTRDYDNGVTASYAYNANDWITELVHAAGTTEIADFGHGYDKEGNKLYEEKSPGFLAGQSEAYHYDDVYRLIEYKVGDLVGSDVPMPITQRQYDLDKVGNWDQFTVDDDGAGPSVPVVYNNTPNQMNEYDHWSTNGAGEIPDDLGLNINFADPEPTPPEDGENWAHDKNGNRREDGQRVYEYDDENRLVRMTRKIDVVVSEYRYDALGRRVAKTVDALGTPVETRYFYDDARIVEEQDTGGATLATYVYGNYIDEVLSMARGGQDYYFHQNALWSVSAMTDALANVVERYTYTDYGCPTITDGAGVPVAPNAWGTAHSAIGNPYMFTGRRWDEESGLYYYRARYYDCESGRFLQRDPVTYAQLQNAYAYVDNAPTTFLDPFGLEFREFIGASNYSYHSNVNAPHLYMPLPYAGPMPCALLRSLIPRRIAPHEYDDKRWYEVNRPKSVAAAKEYFQRELEKQCQALRVYKKPFKKIEDYVVAPCGPGIIREGGRKHPTEGHLGDPQQPLFERVFYIGWYAFRLGDVSVESKSGPREGQFTLRYAAKILLIDKMGVQKKHGGVGTPLYKLFVGPSREYVSGRWTISNEIECCLPLRGPNPRNPRKILILLR